MTTKTGPNVDRDYPSWHTDKGCVLHPCCLECPEDECIEVLGDSKRSQSSCPIPSDNYLELVGRLATCCLCGDTKIITNPYDEIHRPAGTHYGQGQRWFCNGLLGKDGILLVRFFVCPPCQGPKGANLSLAWERAQKRATTLETERLATTGGDCE